jgi:hypothetical protein
VLAHLQAMRALGYMGVEFDIRHGKAMDITTFAGMGLCLLLVLSIDIWGLFVADPPSNTWVAKGRHATGRSKDKPGGNLDLKAVRSANLVNHFMSVMASVCNLRRVMWCYTQPMGSSFFYSPPFYSLERIFDHVFLYLKTHGHAQLKPTTLLGTLPGLLSVAEPVGKLIRLRVAHPLGMLIHGDSRLKQSHVFPMEFCRCIVDMFKVREIPGEAKGLDADVYLPPMFRQAPLTICTNW